MSSLVTIDLDDLHAERDRLMAERERLLDRKMEVESKLANIDAAEKVAIAYGKRIAVPAHESQAEPSGAALSKADLSGKTLFEIAAIILKNAGRPMRTKEIADAALAANPSLKSTKNLPTALFTAMDRKKEIFEKVDRGLWGLFGSSANGETVPF